MDFYLRSDLDSAIYSLSSIASSGFNKINSSIDDLMYEVDAELSSIYNSMTELLDEVREARAEQFIQNEHRNTLLESIDQTLKTPSQTSAEEKFKMAVELVNRKEHELSISYFLEAIQLNPLHFYARVHLSGVYSKLQQYENALSHALSALSHTENQPKRKAFAHYMISKAYFGLTKYEQSIHEIEEAIKLDRLAMYYFEGSRFYAHEGNSERSMHRLIRAINGNREYYEYALVDKIYLNIHKDLLQTLSWIKKQAQIHVESSNKELTQFTLPNYPLENRKDINTKPYAHYWEQIKFGYNHRMALEKVIKMKEDSNIYLETFTYNRFIEEIRKEYQKINFELDSKRLKISKLIEMDTYVKFCEAMDEFSHLKKKYQESLKSFSPVFKIGYKRSQEYLKVVEDEIPLLLEKEKNEKLILKKQPFKLFLSQKEKEQKVKNEQSIQFIKDRIEKMNLEKIEATRQVEAFKDLLDYSVNHPLPVFRRSEEFSLIINSQRQWAIQEEVNLYPYHTEKLINCLERELLVGEVFWNKKEDSESVGTKHWFVRLTQPNPTLNEFLIHIFKKQVMNNELIILKNGESNTKNAHNPAAMIGDITAYSQGIISDTIIEEESRATRLIEWNGIDLFVNNDFLAITDTNIVNVKQEKGPILFGEDHSIVILPIVKK